MKKDQSTRRADIVLFLNGLPLGIIELKNPADENTDVWDAWNQLQTYVEKPAPLRSSYRRSSNFAI